MKHDDIWCSNEYANQPDWIEVALSDKDKANVKTALKFLRKHGADQVRFHLDGKLDWPEDFDAKVRMWELIVTPYNVWVGFADDWSDSLYEVQLGKEELK